MKDDAEIKDFLDFSAGEFVVLSKYKFPKKKRKIIDYISNKKNSGFTEEEISRATGVSRNYVSEVLNELTRKGTLRVILKKGKKAIPQKVFFWSNVSHIITLAKFRTWENEHKEKIEAIAKILLKNRTEILNVFKNKKHDVPYTVLGIKDEDFKKMMHGIISADEFKLTNDEKIELIRSLSIDPKFRHFLADIVYQACADFLSDEKIQKQLVKMGFAKDISEFSETLRQKTKKRIFTPVFKKIINENI